MVENGLYIVKDLYFSMFEKYGCKFKYNKHETRPTFCCIQDRYVEEMFWAIPTSKITKEKNIDRIKKYINNGRGIEKCFYHKGHTNVPCIFCISSCFPIIEKYIERPYIVQGKHLIIRDNQQNKIIGNKLRRILQAENELNNRFEQKITLIEEMLIEELKCEKNVNF